jgi:hypothetical protein
MIRLRHVRGLLQTPMGDGLARGASEDPSQTDVHDGSSSRSTAEDRQFLRAQIAELQNLRAKVIVRDPDEYDFDEVVVGGKKMTFARLLSKAVREATEANPDRRVRVGALDGVKKLGFLPDAPAVVDEPIEETAGRTAKIVRALDAEESLDKNGLPKLNFRDVNDVSKFLPGLVSFFSKQKRKLGAVAADSESLRVIDDTTRELLARVNDLLQHMDIMGYPQASRDFLNEVLFDMKKTVESESSVLGRDIIDHTVNYLYKSGKIASLAGEIAADIKKKQYNNSGRGGGSSSSSSEGAQAERQKFVFNPKQFPQQKRPEAKPFLCYHCVNGLLRAGKIKEGENPPEDCWFASFRELNAHKRQNKCKK